jgi:hypothetical protein
VIAKVNSVSTAAFIVISTKTHPAPVSIRMDSSTYVATSVSQQGTDFQEAAKRIGPAVREEEWQRVRAFTAFVNDVNRQVVLFW